MIEPRFTDALREASPQNALLVACRQLREWIDLPEAECVRRIRSVLTNERVARSLAQAKSLVWGRLAREFAAPSVDLMAALGALDARTAGGMSTSADQEYVRRVTTLLRIHAFVAASFPAAVSATAHNPQLEEIVAMVPPLEAAIHGCDVHVATAASIAALESAIEVFTRCADSWTPPIHANHAWWIGMAQYTVGRAALEIGDAALARDAFQAGVLAYERAGEWDDADDLRARVMAIDHGRRGDVNAAIANSVQELLAPQDVLRHAKSLAALAAACKESGDQFEYARVTTLLADGLIAAGYVDPELDALHAMRIWAETAAEMFPGDDLLKRVSQLANHWAVVMGARSTDRNIDGTLRDASRAARAEKSLAAIGDAMGVLLAEAAALSAELSAELAEWYGPDAALSGAAGGAVDVSLGMSAVDGETPRPDAARNASKGAAISSALYALRLACNQGATDEQLTQVKDLVDEARALGSRIHEVQALLEQAYVLLALTRYADVSPVTHDALRVLSSTRNATLDAFTLAHERELYLSAKQFEARGLVGLKDHHRLLDLCQPVIRELEQQRARVTTPYQQSAFLATRAEFYEYCAAAAYKLGLHNLLLETTERLKASSAWRLGPILLDTLPSGVASEIAALDSAYVEVNRELATSQARGVALDELLERRRRIASARAIARGKAYVDPRPTVTLERVQQALGDEEAAMSWFWLSEDLLLVLTFTRDRFETFQIELSPDALRQFERWIVGMSATTEAGGFAIGAEVDGLVDALGATLFPDRLRAFIRGKTRIILSPHRALHLFPFHAIRVFDDIGKPWLIQQAAVRYAPNLTSLLLEWRGNHEGPVLAIGINHFGDTSFPSLENAVREAELVSESHAANGYVAVDVTRAVFTSMPLATYRCLHLATHGTSVLTGKAPDDPLDCGIAFADGLLDGWQLASLDIRAELVVLASCYSGQRAIGGRGLAKLPGDDILGLQAVVFEAGVGTILGALWPVDDESSRAILVDFHRHYAAGRDPDRALQSALITYLANPFRRRGRYDWAPFFLTSVRNPRAHTRPL